MSTWPFVLLPTLFGAAQAKNLTITAVTAKSSYSDDSAVRYDASNLNDRKTSTVWIEGEDGSGLGSWVAIALDGPQTVTGLRLWNGNWYSTDLWTRHNRLKEVQIGLSDGTEHVFTLKDVKKVEEIRFPTPVTTDKLTLHIRGTYRGTTFNDTSLSEIQVFNDEPDGSVQVKAMSASSVYPADIDGDYEPANILDGLDDSMWCEADRGDGVGQWIEFDLGKSSQVGQLWIVNGNAHSWRHYGTSNRATTATVTFSDGATRPIAFKHGIRPQTIPLGSHTTSTVRVTFDQVNRGTDFNDLCVSEAALLP